MRPTKPAEGSGASKVPAAGDSPDSPRPSSPRASGRWKPFFWPLVCLFQLGLIAGTLQFGSLLMGPDKAESLEAPEEAKPLAEDWKKDNPEPEKSRAARGELDDVDRLIRAGRYELALVLCRSFSQQAIAEGRNAFQYRLGLCLEGLGRWDDALTAYRKLASHAPSARVAAIASIGQARVWLRIRRPAESQSLLCDLLRRSALPALHGQPFLADARYFLALASPYEVLPNEPPCPLNDAPANPLASDWSLDRALDWDRQARLPESEPPSPGEIIEFHARGEKDGLGKPSPEQGAIRIFVLQTALPSLLDQLAERAGLRIEWSSLARRETEDRSFLVALQDVSLAEALRLLIEPLGLMGTIRDGKMILASEGDVTAEELKARRAHEARRSLREALRTYPRHPLTPAAYLVLGNLEIMTGHLNEAASWYVRLAREWPRTPLVVEANYNLGMLRSRQGDRVAARQAFYRVVDRAPAHELAPLAYWRIGRTYLEEGEPEQALSPLRRACSLAGGGEGGSGESTQAAAALTLAAAHLLTDNPRAANSVLREHRALVNRDSTRNAAAFLDTLARFRSATDRRQRQREAGDLLAVLLNVRDEPLLGLEGTALIGQAYREMSMTEEMTRYYKKALEKMRGPLAARLTWELAEEFWATEKFEAALPWYQKLTTHAAANEAKRARLRLAEIALIEKKPQDCLKSCRELLEANASVDVPAVLRLMARAYEQTGEHEKAIRCLSGQLP